MTRDFRTLLAALLLAPCLLWGCDDGGGDDAGTDGAVTPTDAGPGTDSCTDGTMNQDETDVDCGGVCGATCTPGQMCGVAGDCTTGTCTSGTCAADPSCMDSAQNGMETDVDCGGPMCMGCDDGEMCAADTDCTSMFCSGGACADPTCGNGTVEGPEDCDDGVGGTPTETATCDDDCSTAECGDGVRNSAAGEACDGDGMGMGGETVSCDADCTGATCGDGVVNAAAGEDCDGDGAGVGGETATCDVDCSTQMCGDGLLNRAAGEQCDDGNTVDTDLCTNACTINGPSVSVTADATFNTDTGELDGTVSAGWDGASATLFVSDFNVDAGVTLTLTGTNPFQVESAGDVTVAGTIDASGGDGEFGTCNGDGGAGGLAGPGGGNGGDGGRIGFAAPATIDGQPGAGTGGGQPGGVDEAGGGGAGHAAVGETGVGDQATSVPGVGGDLYVALVSLEGGSGGGGGSGDDDPPVGIDMADDGGGGGGGGGGAVSFLSSGTLTVSGAINAAGGAGGDGGCDPNSGSGGGGSGGTIVLISSSAAPVVTGATLDVSGGAGGAFGPSGGAGAIGETYVGLPPTCSDGAINQDESDVDCGGTICAGCALADDCRRNADCGSMVCVSSICVPPACNDGSMNNMETDVDCGGPDCAPCADGLMCTADTDCAGSGCESNVCVSCSDGAQNDLETDVDCGGTECGPCLAGRNCSAATDCTSGVCLSGGTCDFVADNCSNAFALASGDNVVPWETRANDYLTTFPACIPTFDVMPGVPLAPLGADVVMSYTVGMTGFLQYEIDKPQSQRWALIVSSGTCGTLTPEDDCLSDFVNPSMTGTFPVTAGTTYYFYLIDTNSGAAPLSQPLNVNVVEVASTCFDGSLSGSETDVDCGGPDTGAMACPTRCATGETCAADTDCFVGGCDATSCRAFTTLDDFESGAPLGAIWTTTGDANWFVSNVSPITGTFSAQAGAIPDNGATFLDTTVTCTANAALRFDLALDADVGDLFAVIPDGFVDPRYIFAGTTAGTLTVPLDPGPHTLTFTYQKDAAVTAGADTVRIDNVSLVNCTNP